MLLGPVTLEGEAIRLEPLRPRHAAGLAEAAKSAEIWGWMPSDLSDRSALEGSMAQALADEEAGRSYAFAVVRRTDERILGSTRYLDVRPSDRGVEIGWTWYSPDTWGTSVNPEAKYLLLGHAFERWGAIRVQLKTDHRNLHSQAAIRKLGAQYEGTLRNHQIRRDGTVRHTVMFSITEAEWPEAKRSLADRLALGERQR